jgi:hypothetical protein
MKRKLISRNCANIRLWKAVPQAGFDLNSFNGMVTFLTPALSLIIQREITKLVLPPAVMSGTS